MAASTIDTLRGRIRHVGNSPLRDDGRCVLYFMSRDQRIKDNHTLLAAQSHASKQKVPLVVCFILMPKTGFRAREHYEFMLAGLHEVAEGLLKHAISFELILAKTSCLQTAKQVIHKHQPIAAYVDFNPLRGPQQLYRQLSEDIALYEVDTHNIVPVRQLSSKQEFGAYTIRPKLHKRVAAWLEEPEPLHNHPYGDATLIWPEDNQIEALLSRLPRNGTTCTFESGEAAAQAALATFIDKGVQTYAAARNDAVAEAQSGLSPYLHYGQLSSLRVALALRERLLVLGQDLHLLESPKIPSSDEATLKAGADALLEEMIVRKELSDNFCLYNAAYDSLAGAPAWARASLDAHRADPREHLYDYQTLADGKTADELWNASQRQLRQTGKIHGYMRMYWAKKVLEWTASPEEAIDYLIRLNDFYSIDGGDPNGYVGILWSVAGLHDRPWFERPIYGKIRYMNQTGAAKRFTIEQYIDKYK